MWKLTIFERKFAKKAEKWSNEKILSNIQEVVTFVNKEINTEGSMLTINDCPFISWREAHSSTGRLVTGSGQRDGAENKIDHNSINF